ncbi:Putative reactive intermediate deaminase TdcF [Baekduia alba]|uniref:RidA family protein n=1 Tax=Baekduia alba TaxID=2997333 RepID=UPI00234077E8|nr:RidA family protein [Baekduia alba]WCB91452.1 Putative reactive intermediate deaminase TdcF [Baekduia alba]
MALPEFASPAGLPTPAGYSHVVGLPPGRLVWTSGQVALDATGAAPEGWEAQTRLVFENVGGALAAAGATFADVVKLSFFVTGVAELATVRAVRDEFVDTANPPTSSLVQVAGLIRPDLLVEVEAVAWRPPA